MKIIPAWLAGALLGVLAALGSLAFDVYSPAYGLCVACHARDLINGSLNGLFGLGLDVAPAAWGGWILSVPGLLLGAWLGARLSGEVRRRPARQPARSFLLGLLTMSFSLLALGCTTRLLLRAAYGDALSYWTLAGAAVGIAGATGLLAWHARRWSA